MRKTLVIISRRPAYFVGAIFRAAQLIFKSKVLSAALTKVIS